MLFYDLNTFEKSLELSNGTLSCNGAEFHPFLPYFASATGERQYDGELDASSVAIWTTPLKSAVQ